MPGPGAQNVAHVRPMPQLTKGKGPPNQSKSMSAPDLLKNPSQLYQMVSVEINGVHKKVMVPVSAPSCINVASTTSVATTASPSSSSQMASTSVVPSSPLQSNYTMSCSKEADNTAQEQTSAPQSIDSVRPSAPAFPRSAKQSSFKLAGMTMAKTRPKQHTPAANSFPAVSTSFNNTSLLGGRCILTHTPDGKQQLVILAASTGSQTSTESLVIPNQIVTSSNTQSSQITVAMPRLSAAPSYSTASTKTPRLSATPSYSTAPTKTVTVASSVSSVQPTPAVQSGQVISTSNGPVLGYLIGNQLLLPQSSMLPVTTPTCIPTAVTPNLSSHSAKVAVASSAQVHTPVKPAQSTETTLLDATSTASNHQPFSDQASPVSSSELKIDTVFSLQKNMLAGNTQPEIIEIKPDSDNESVEYQDHTYTQPSDIAVDGSKVAQVSEVSNTSGSDQMCTLFPPEGSDSVLAQPTAGNTIKNYRLVHSSNAKQMSANPNFDPISPQPVNNAVDTATLKTANTLVSAIPRQAFLAGLENAQKKVAPPTSTHPRLTGHKYKKGKKQTARKSTSKPTNRIFPQKPFDHVTLKVGKDRRLTTFSSFATLKKYFPFIRNCQVKLLKLPQDFNVKLPSMPNQPGSALVSEESPGAELKNKVFLSEGQNLKITQTGRKTVIQPALTGSDKGKFLMIKTNAGTFLVPVNQEHSKVTGTVSAADSTGTNMKILPPVSDKKGDNMPTSLPHPKVQTLFRPDQKTPQKSPRTIIKKTPLWMSDSCIERRKVALTSLHQDDTSPKKHRLAGSSPSKAEPSPKRQKSSELPPKKYQTNVDDEFAKDKKSSKSVQKGSSLDRIRELKEKLQMQQEEAQKAKQAIENSKNVLDAIDLD